MSRSEKRTPIVKCPCTKTDKRLASKAARHKDFPDGCAYKKAYNSYNLHDWRTNLWQYVKRNRHPDLDILRFFWKK